MLFGFVGAVIAGFLLTAIPNWTGRLPIAGPPLAALTALWVAARAAVWFSGEVGLLIAAVLDVGFYLVFAFVAGREVIAAKNRNVPVVGLVLLFAIADACDYAGAAGWLSDPTAPARAAIAVVVTIISVIGGRVIPSFTRNWMSKQGFKSGLPGQPTRFDLATIGVTAVGLVIWIVAPQSSMGGAVLVLAGLLQAVRLARWRGWRTWSDSIVLVLHVGYAWVPLGLLLLGASALGAAVPRTAAVHALTAGAMATMILAMMTRATLGHTGHELKAGPATAGSYVCVTIGAVLRVLAALGLIGYRVGIETAGAFWALGFAIFVIGYAPIMFRSRKGDPSR
jgi:uncharacterized protein involved in response to NO